MTALKEFARLESDGLWRPDPEAQRREVALSFGDATLVISDGAGRALTHWSLAAIDRLNPGVRPAIFTPDPDATETLEVADDLMIDALEKVRKTILRARPHPGRLRNVGLLAVALAVLAIAVIWMPGALVRQAQSAVPPVKRSEIGASLLGHMQRLTGPSCRGAAGTEALARLHRRVLGPDASGQVVIVPGGPEMAVYLPGGIIVLHRAIVEAPEDPAVAAGYILAAAGQRQDGDPLAKLLDHAGLRTTVRLLTTGEMPPEALRSYAEDLLIAPPPLPPAEALLPLFGAAQVPSTPFAYALDATGETTLALIEADPLTGQAPPALLTDGEWISLQGICS